MARVSLKNVSKAYPGGRRPGRHTGPAASEPAHAVESFSLEIPDAAFVVLVGPSGCGKSTTLRMIAGLEEITSGTIEIDGKVVNDVPPKDRDIAMVFQNYALYPHMTAYKNLAFPLKMRKVPRDEIERRVRGAAGALGIEGLLDRKPGQLSGGQRQRVALGRAIVREPKAFLFDEPLSNLDAKLRLTTRAELKALHLRLKTTTIYVTHDQEEAMTLGDLVVVMSKGRIQQAGTPLEIYHKPANRFVASFIGMPPMNFLEGTLRPAASGLEFLAAPRPGSGNGAAIGGAGGNVDGGADRIDLRGLSVESLREHIGKPLVLGVRPQAIEVDRADTAAGGGGMGGGAGGWRATVRVTEVLGDQMDIFATTAGGADVVIRSTAMDGSRPAPRPGEVISLRAAAERVYFFEPGEFGVRVR